MGFGCTLTWVSYQAEVYFPAPPVVGTWFRCNFKEIRSRGREQGLEMSYEKVFHRISLEGFLEDFYKKNRREKVFS